MGKSGAGSLEEACPRGPALLHHSSSFWALIKLEVFSVKVLYVLAVSGLSPYFPFPSNGEDERLMIFYY